MFSRTGQQLFCLDSDHGDPFLVVLADPCEFHVPTAGNKV